MQMMLKRKGNNSIISMLCSREINYDCCTPGFWSSLVFRQIIKSDNDFYSKSFIEASETSTSYDSRNLYLDDYKEYCPLNVVNRQVNEPPRLLSMELIDEDRRYDAISYSGKCQIEHAFESDSSVCLSPSLISISENGWMYQHLLKNGQLVKRVYLNLFEHYMDSFLLASENYGQYSFMSETIMYNDDIETQLFVFKYPLEFFSRMEIKTSVFGEDIEDVKLFNEFLILRKREIGATNYVYTFYQFDDFIKQGTFTPYRFGDDYEDKGKIGSYPTGVPINFNYNEAPPVLFKLDASHVYFGLKSSDLHRVIFYPTGLVLSEANTPIQLDELLIKYSGDNILLYPDQSNRLIIHDKTKNSMDFYKIPLLKFNRKISKQFSVSLTEEPSDQVLRKTDSTGSPLTILAYAYEPELDIFAIFGKCHSSSTGLVKLYDNGTGENLRTIEISGLLILDKEQPNYELEIDTIAILIFEYWSKIVHVYML